MLRRVNIQTVRAGHRRGAGGSGRWLCPLFPRPLNARARDGVVEPVPWMRVGEAGGSCVYSGRFRSADGGDEAGGPGVLGSYLLLAAWRIGAYSVVCVR